MRSRQQLLAFLLATDARSRPASTGPSAIVRGLRDRPFSWKFMDSVPGLHRSRMAGDPASIRQETTKPVTNAEWAADGSAFLAEKSMTPIPAYRAAAPAHQPHRV